MLDEIKLFLTIDEEDTSQDDLLFLIIEEVEQFILDYCNIRKLPDKLKYIVKQLVISRFKTITEDNNVASIKRGDTQITYNTSVDMNSFTKEQISILNKFRKVKYD